MLDLNKLTAEQLKLAKRVILNDDYSEIKTIAGCDIAYTADTIISAIVVMDLKTLKIRETKYHVGKSAFPYLAGFLSYREAPITIETYHKLELDPDLLIIDGNGILHPRRFGLASHLGLSLDKPSIGITKNLLCGEEKGDAVYLDKEVIGKLVKTKDIANPIYVSQGHKISLKSAIEIVKKTITDHKLPEPLHEAHKLANKIKRKIKSEEKKTKSEKKYNI